MIQHIVRENRIGKFNINTYIIENLPGTAMMLLSQMIIIRAEMKFEIMGIEYTAYSHLFEPCSHNALTPEYLLKFNSNRGVIAEKSPW